MRLATHERVAATDTAREECDDRIPGQVSREPVERDDEQRERGSREKRARDIKAAAAARSARAEKTLSKSPIGTLIAKSHGHGANARIAPPIVGPAAEFAATVSALMPTATPSWRAGNIERLSAGAMLMIAAPPKPCTTRAVMRSGNVGESAHASEPSVKIAIPLTYTRR